MSTSNRHGDRVGLAAWLMVALTLTTALAAGIAGQSAARGRLTSSIGFLAGFGVVVLALVGLPSLSVRVLARTLLGISAIVLVRFGVLAGSVGTGGQLLLAWVVLALAVLVLSDRVDTDSAAPLTPPAAQRAAPTPASATARTGAVAVLVVVAAALVVGPIVLPHVGSSVEAGQGPSAQQRGGQGGALRASNDLDMTSRPDLTDRVVFTVDTDRPTFWRGQTYDRWDGRRWYRTDRRLLSLLPGNRTTPAADDLGAKGDDVVVQRFRVEANLADLVFAAPTPVEIDAGVGVRQRPDGTLVLMTPVGQGATYTVTSRRTALTEQQLRAATGPIPADVRERYLEPPVMTDRVRLAARAAVGDATNPYDQVRAIETWMADRVAYSIDAPLAPQGVDVVDHFLFEAEEGWCEQIASSLVVLARANGIPARLVTGYVPDERDPVTGTYTVRERDAHAWAEVWFPELGWVPFDPTASVPLAGSEEAPPTASEWLVEHAVVLVLGVVAAVLLLGAARRLVRRLRARRADRPATWAAAAELRLDRLGRRVDRPRRVDETAGAYAEALARRYDDPDLAAVGHLVDDALYAPTPPGPEACAAATAVLERVAVTSPGPRQEVSR